MTSSLVPILDGLAFAEGPRWHEGRLWFSDMHARSVQALEPATGDVEIIVEVDGQPSGLGWRPDGTLLIVSMLDRQLLALVDGDLREVADLSAVTTSHCNDMVVDGGGNAYIGNFGFDLHDPEADQCTTTLALVTVDGEVRVVADDLFFPNGAVITPDGSTLVVGESFGGGLTAFDVEPDGSLSGRREWARVRGAVPDGICLDRDGAIWMASPISHQVLRVAEGGEVLDEIRTSDERQPFACMLGGADGTTLFVCTAIDSDPESCRRQMAGRIESVEVDVPGAGRP
ncbi:SMP-30/gluconolactonase/LRE family protein [Actinospongicola halichondriae]|uniref:SMP-30/gluconolactonase/LRE family protein n=1 Tax=Actinospongicola halichondriae TaxID=3236844 RepID=UPI003D3A7C81